MAKTVSVILMSLLVLGTLVLVFKVPTVKAGMIIVPNDYPTIQAAINNANSGDTIFVRNGKYDEDLVINKDSLTLIGESHDAWINGTLWIRADNVTVKGFKIADAVAYYVIGAMMTDELSLPIIEVSGCHNTAILGNIVEGYIVVDTVWFDFFIGGEGCILEDGGNNAVRNNVFNNCLAGIEISSESNDFVIGNDIISTVDFSLLLGGAENTTIYHNNFFIAGLGALPEYSNSTWDNGYPSGGNYWSDYNGADLHSGRYQNETGTDGIGDTPYVVDANNLDNYPLMSPWVRINGDLNGDGKVNLADLILLANAYGSRVGDPRWNPFADLAPPYGIIGLTDLVTMAMNYGQHNP